MTAPPRFSKPPFLTEETGPQATADLDVQRHLASCSAMDGLCFVYELLWAIIITITITIIIYYYYKLVGGLEDFFYFSICWEQLTNSIIFQRGWNHQPDKLDGLWMGYGLCTNDLLRTWLYRIWVGLIWSCQDHRMVRPREATDLPVELVRANTCRIMWPFRAPPKNSPQHVVCFLGSWLWAGNWRHLKTERGHCSTNFS